MPLTPNQKLLLHARNAYVYPFSHLTALRGSAGVSTKGASVDNPIAGPLAGMTFRDWEGRHQFLLRYSKKDLITIPGLAGDETYVMLGVASVLYWGFFSHSPGFAAARVRRFRDGRNGVPADPVRVRDAVHRAAALVDANQYGEALKVVSSSIPEFGQVSFASKLVMALSPSRCAVYDRWIAQIVMEAGGSLERDFWCAPNNGGVTPSKAAVYQRWCELCQERAAEMNAHPVDVSGWTWAPGLTTDWRAVDVERALFVSKNVAILRG
jgi:hypothetical protein